MQVRSSAVCLDFLLYIVSTEKLTEDKRAGEQTEVQHSRTASMLICCVR